MTPTATSLIEGAQKAQLPVNKKRATISGEGNRKPGVNSEGMTPTAGSLIEGAQKAQLPKSGGQ
ncbi:MAG: hypothetical protein NUV87_01705 [Candidatus Roizmanbacteria bacterium]|nr:hypothetical protein [Candidatus Roizmanbacteria bacterium]